MSNQATSYYSTITGITGGQVQIPQTVYSWGVVVQSGTAFINSFPIFAGQPAIEGGWNGELRMRGSYPINIGCTGGRVLVYWDN